MTESRERTCSFCGRAGGKIVAGPEVFICRDCTELASDFFDEERGHHGPGGETVRLPKFHGLENDFLMHDLRDHGAPFSVEESIHLLDRRRGVGADGILMLSKSHSAAARMVVRNADGSIAEMCGNGIRCAAKYLADQSGQKPAKLDIETGAGVLACLLTYGVNNQVTEVEVEMGRAHLFAPNLPQPSPFIDAPIPGHEDLRGTAVSLGNPHLVLSAAPLEDVERLGPILEHHPAFANGANVEFVQQTDEGLRVNVWERGSGFTRACGTGACAAAAAWVQRRLLPADTWIPVDLPGGRLHVHVAKGLSLVRMRGPAEYTFDAVVRAPAPR